MPVAMAFGSLWLPVVVSAVAVFVVSSVLHMALTYHRADYRKLPNEDDVGAALGKDKPAPGIYVLPYCAGPKEMQEPAMKAKYEKGPVAIITVLQSGLPQMPKLLGLWFLFSLLVSFTAGYVARHTLQPGSDAMLVMRITGTVAFSGYGMSNLIDSIWKGQPWSNTVRGLLDALVYAVTTGLTFRLLWPAA